MELLLVGEKMVSTLALAVISCMPTSFELPERLPQANSDPTMYGNVTGPSAGISGQQGVIFTGSGTDKDDDGEVIEMKHTASFNSTPSDSSAPGVKTHGPVLNYGNSETGEKRWEVAYTLVTVPENEVWVKQCEMILNDDSSNALRIDFLKIYHKLIAISGPASQGGGG